MESKVLVIANPAAGNGTGTQAARVVLAELEKALQSNSDSFLAGAEIDAAFLSSADQTRALIESSADQKAIITVGGDGLIHLAVNALMKVEADKRPVLGVVPAGTGNDYARALKLPLNVKKAVSCLVGAQPRSVDLGLCNGEYFAETLSFGVDAAIALETVERRAKTGRNDAGVYFSSGINQLRNNLVSRTYHGTADGRPIEGECITFAVQIGPYYGGGFKIYPNAELDDGMLDLCISHPPITVLRALYIFMRAKSGNHVMMKPIELCQAKHLVVDFDEEPPCQIDGEPLHATHYDVTCEPAVLKVLA